MKPAFVFATAHSRLLADIMMIRLRRAGINIGQVSAIFSGAFAPSTFFFWLSQPQEFRSTAVDEGEVFFVAGSMQELFPEKADVRAVSEKLCEVGVERRTVGRLVDAVRRGEAVVCVQAKNQDEIAVTLDIFRHSKSENVAVTTAVEKTPAKKNEVVPVNAWAAAFAL